MAKLTLNKTALNRQRRSLRTYERFFPSLDLKRRQLVAERQKAARRLERTHTAIRGMREGVARDVPMLAYEALDLSGLARVRSVELEEENLMGAQLPVLVDVEVEFRQYSYLGRPHWVDTLASRLARMLELKVRARVEAERLRRLERAVQRVTQRVNLFDKVLIPRARRNIKRIQIHLSDAERAGVVRTKIAKAKRRRTQ